MLIFKSQRCFKLSAYQHERSRRAASLEDQKILPTAPVRGSTPFLPPARGDKGPGRLLRRMTQGIR